MSAARNTSPTTSTTLRLQFGAVAVQAHVAVPAAPVAPGAVLPALQSLVNDVVAAAERQEAAAGRAISCRKGCGACCRQLVPVAPVEAAAVADLIETLPAPRARAVRARFAAIERRLDDAGLTSMLLEPEARHDIDDRSLSLRYFALGLACPFLEDEACSIHLRRPLACREYLVTSPASHCARPDQAGVTPVPVPKLSVGARGLDAAAGQADTTASWLPLSLALAWNRRRRPTPELRSGPDWIQRFLTRLRIPPARHAT